MKRTKEKRTAVTSYGSSDNLPEIKEEQQL